MSKINNSLYNIRLLDDLAQKESVVHKLHPLIKLLTTLVYLVVVVSFEKYDISALLPLIFYPVLLFSISELPAIPILKRVLFAMPFIIGIGIWNPFFDTQIIIVGGIHIARGWFAFFSLVLKCILTVTASILLIATTGMGPLSHALRMLKVPKIFILQLTLTYRYLSVLMEEISKMMRAHSLRAPQQKGIHPAIWGCFCGQLILRTFDRAKRVYDAMSLRGFHGEYPAGTLVKPKASDFVYFISWSVFFILIRLYNLPNLMGDFFIEVIK